LSLQLFDFRYYGSRFDDASNVDVPSIMKTADLVANTLMKLVNNSYNPGPNSRLATNGTLVNPFK
jgi:hypothetical protein